MDKEIQANQRWLDMWHERTSPLDPSSPNRFWEKEKEREKKESFCKERVSTFSLNFPVIEPSNPGEQEAKLLPTTRATRGYQFSTTPGGRGLLLLDLVLI